MLGRLKFEISNLVNEMLDQIPDEIWESEDKTFIDPAMGGGQFVKEVEQRLREKGHSNENITNRVFGMEKNKLRVNYAINKHGLIGKYWVGDHESEIDMKFDVVVGNPPYQSGKGEKGGKSAVWRKFVKLADSLLNENGFAAMITPRLPNTASDIGYFFTNNQTLVVKSKIAKHFSGIGSSFFAWIVHKAPKHKKTIFVDEQIEIDLDDKPLANEIKMTPLFRRLYGLPSFKCVSSPEYYHTSIAKGVNEDYLSANESDILKYKLRRTSGETYHMFGAKEPTDYYDTKVVLTFSGNPHYKVHDKDSPIGTIKFQSGHILVDSVTHGENLIKLYNTKLYKWLMSQWNTGGMKGACVYTLPKVDLNRKWTNKELYKYFGLTTEEIQHIEENIA